jgi:hypothetical protein
MPHVDEGTLHALLDGELAPAEAAEVRVHFATCPSCAARLDEARHLLAETERLVSALELPGSAAHANPRPAPAASTSAAASAAAAPTAANVLLPASPGTPLPPLDPVVLIPENPTVREVRRSRMRVMAWAAGFLVVVGAGFLGVTSYQQAPRSTDGKLRISPDEFTTAPPRAQREGAGADSAPTLSLTDSAAPALAPANAPAAGTPESKAEPAAPTPKPPAPAPRPVAPEPKPTVAQQRAVVPAPPPATGGRADADQAQAQEKDEELRLAKAAAAGDALPRDNTAPADSRAEPAVSRTAAEATSDLDRRRTRERAAEATAALDRENAQRRAAEERERQLAAERAAAAPAAAPARPPVDERTGISARIGLDEAARQLGGPLHAIDGMARQTVGLVDGTSVDGADPARPVVRAVYVDRSSGMMLFLDQQMARPGEGPATPQTGKGGRQIWVKDGVLLVLHGDVGADSLRSLARRVR